MWPISSRQHVPRSAQKRSSPSKETQFYWVASAAASAALRTLPRYLPWLRRDALHPSTPDTTRVARLNQCFLKLFQEQLSPTIHSLRVYSCYLQRFPYRSGDGVVDRDADLTLQLVHQRSATQIRAEDADCIRAVTRNFSHHLA